MESTLYDKSNVKKCYEQTKMTRRWKEMCLITYFLWNFTDFSHVTGEIYCTILPNSWRVWLGSVKIRPVQVSKFAAVIMVTVVGVL